MTLPGAARSPLLVALLLALAPDAARADGAASRVAVVGVTQGPVPAAVVAAVARVTADAADLGGADVVAPDEVARAVGAAGSDPAACAASAACAIIVCATVRADALLFAKVKDSGTFWYVEMRLRDGRRGSVKGQTGATVAKDEASAKATAARLAGQVLRALAPTSDLPPPAIARAPAPVAAPPAPVAPPPPNLAPARPRAARGELVPPEPAPPRAAPSGRRRWGAIVAVGGAALLAGGAAAGAIAWSESGGANLSLARGDLAGFAYGRQSSSTYALTAAGLGAAGTVALAAGAWLWFGAGPASVALDARPGAAGARVAIAF